MTNKPASGSGRHSNVSLFVPHAGCPHRCSFCNQRVISGAVRMPAPEDVRQACEIAVKTMRSGGEHAEIAFFGGSFTAINRENMLSLLEAAEPYVRQGYFKGIRVSTRPDAVDKPVLALLKEYGVSAVELGAQSMQDGVLLANGRGHTASDVVRASALIQESGIELGLQMMTGLHKSSGQDDIETAEKLAALHPTTVRIYPTLVITDTALCRLYRSGEYTPQTLGQAVNLCAVLLRFFEREKGIRVIRLGLHSGSDMQAGLVAGPWHPAFRELCESTLFFDAALSLLKKELPQGGGAALLVHPRDISRMTGQKRCNIIKLSQFGYDVKIHSDGSVLPGKVEMNGVAAL